MATLFGALIPRLSHQGVFSRTPFASMFAIVSVSILTLSACGGGSSSAPSNQVSSDVSNTSTPPVVSDSPPSTSSNEPTLQWHTAYEREADYPNTVNLPQQLITMQDGTRLAATVTLPADEHGIAINQAFPVIATFTGYNQAISGMAGAIAGSDAALVQRGYAYITVDMRGTGASEGSWQAFGKQDHQDIAELIEYIATQPWSNGRIGMNGASYMAITGLLAGASEHPAVQAIFATVPMGDAYRDIVFSGGQINAGFIPLWMGLVTGLSVIPTSAGFDNQEPGYFLNTVLQHLQGAVTDFQVPVVAGALVGNEHRYDSPFWRIRSPLEQVDKIQAPTFVVGGLNDIFQRGEPLIYEGLSDHTTAKLLIGPWTHLDGSHGAGLPADGVPGLPSLRLAWFDQYLKDIDTGASNYPPVTQYYTGTERYITALDWPHPQAQAGTFYLHNNGQLPLLGDLQATPDEHNNTVTILQTPVNGLCSASASQWTAGILGMIAPPCAAQDNVSQLLEAVYNSDVLEADMAINGPIAARLWVSTTALDANVVVRVSAVNAQGIARPLSHGIQMLSLSNPDENRSRYLDGKMIQPWHPYTAESRQQVSPLQVRQVDVEVFPTSAVILAGERLRISVGTSDFPHGLSPIPDLLTSLLGALTIHSGPNTPSQIVLPLVPTSAIAHGME